MNRSLLTCVCLTFAFACTSAEPGDEAADSAGSETGDPTTTGDGDGDGDPTTGDGDGDGDPVEVVATIDGVLADMAGQPLPTPGLQFCGPVDAEGNVALCIPISVDAEGNFTIEATQVGTWSMKCVHGPVDGRNFAGQAFQIAVNDGDTLDFTSPAIVIPEVDAMIDLTGANGATEVVIDDVLTVTMDPALAQSPDFTAPTEVGGLAIDAAFWRVTEVDGSPVIAAWAFSAFGIHATDDAGFGFAINGGLGLSPGDPVIIHHIEKVNGVIHEAGTGVVNTDGTAIDITVTGGLHELSWLLVTAG